MRALRFDTVLAFAAPLGCAALLLEAFARTAHGDSQLPERCACDATTAVVTAEHVRELERSGIVLIPLALGVEPLAAARADARRVCASGRLGASGNAAAVRQDRVMTIRESDGTAAAGSAHARALAPLGAGLLHAVRVARGVSHALDVHGYRGLQHRRVPTQVQLAAYAPGGGAGYARHLDACVEPLAELGLLEWLRLSDYRERTVTSILYLNDADWGAEPANGNAVAGPKAGATEAGAEGARGLGGELRCFDANGSGRYRDVVPRGGTLVILDSKAVEHQVLPCTGAHRYALTSWVVSSESGDSPRASRPPAGVPVETRALRFGDV
jgi:hypothetical protein